MRPVFLIGYMGSGKSTLGASLARNLNSKFIDLDNYIEGRFRQSIKQIFAERGEDGFRRLERNMIQEISDFEDVVIACGGGTPCFFDNMELMSGKGITVYLKPSRECLISRLSIPAAKAKRPLIASKTNEELAAFIAEALDKREPYYGKANITFDSGYLESKEMIEQSAASLAELINNHKKTQSEL